MEQEKKQEKEKKNIERKKTDEHNEGEGRMGG